MGGKWYTEDRQEDKRNCRDCCLEIVKQIMGLDTAVGRGSDIRSADVPDMNDKRRREKDDNS